MQRVESLSDLELQHLFVGGDVAAYTELYNRYAVPVNRFMQKYLHTAALSEDATHDVFIKLWNKREQLVNVQSFKAYLFTVARNLAFDYLKSAFRTETAISQISAVITEHRNTVEDERLTREYLLFIENVLATLPRRSREVFMLCREQGKSYDEAAKQLGISRNAIKNHMVLTMKVLSSKVETELGISLSVLLALMFTK
ncbi:RNA polymerase sigma-70 factor (ECF subfamily) [Mucilaginibacter oryzae]|uniref:RNA polymerase sigma-70 factor (ECF subfamily) n=1 Tax=Mucilaginibacter oryzae TaxID=468058 RepID=A0A316HI48_9SPHI|nr:sigma-70 family RNA polymerase sigma factor [Mucilaginibacter oryzae]PWK79813.1 RNA polymerase sigma-70 factor (ECF subfamily) [Mucilaginibacter oryzae]